MNWNLKKFIYFFVFYLKSNIVNLNKKYKIISLNKFLRIISSIYSTLIRSTNNQREFNNPGLFHLLYEYIY